jgi:serine protease Do
MRTLALALLATGALFVHRPAEAADPFLRRTATVRFVPRVPRTTRSLGSGVVIDRMRHVVTNEHVVARADRILVTLADGREFEAELVGADPNNDLAVLEIKTDEKVPWAPPGDSDDLMVGEPVIAIGNPFGLSNTVTTGVVSAQNRSIRAQDRIYHGFLQTDASINPGNSGGPLLNAAGELIGINTAIYGGGAQGIGFAIPIDVAKRVVRELLDKGEIAPVWLGLDLQDLDDQITDVLELPERLSGALVSRVRPDTPAASGGVERGDIVIGVDGAGVGNARGFYEILERTTPGQLLTVTLWRDGASREAKVRSSEIPEAAIAELGEQILGLGLAAAPGGGFTVTTVRGESGAARIGIAQGDRLLGINGKALDGEVALRKAVLDLRGRSRALIVVQRGHGRYHVAVPLG